MSDCSLPGWPWRLFATALAVGAAAAGLLVSPPADRDEPPADTAAAGVLPDTVTLLVLNGSGEQGLARRIQRYFLGSGEGTVWLAPTPPSDADRDDYAETIVVSSVENPSGALLAAERLGLPDSCVVFALDPSAPAEVTIILGDDVAAMADTLIPYSNE